MTAHRAGNVDDPRAPARCWWTCCSPCPCPSCCRCTRGPARAWRRRAGSPSSRPRRTCGSQPPLGYLDFTVAARPRARGPHRLGRRAEGGVPRRRAVRDDARHDRVGRDRRGRAGTSWSTSTRAPPSRRSTAGRPRSGRRSTATAGPGRGWSRPWRPSRRGPGSGRRERRRRSAATGRGRCRSCRPAGKLARRPSAADARRSSGGLHVHGGPAGREAPARERGRRV